MTSIKDMSINDIKRRNFNTNRNLSTFTNPEVHESRPHVPPQEHIVINQLWDYDSDEEDEIIPNSTYWMIPQNVSFIDINEDPCSLIDKLSLENPEDDWRKSTNRGRHSRRNFTNFLVNNL